MSKAKLIKAADIEAYRIALAAAREVPVKPSVAGIASAVRQKLNGRTNNGAAARQQAKQLLKLS